MTNKGNSTDGGATWLPLGGVAPGSALLLAGSARVRFTPKPGYRGRASLSFRAWDGTEGQAGGSADLSAAASVGGATAFSSGVVQANW